VAAQVTTLKSICRQTAALLNFYQMSALEIIKEIRSLPSDEQEKVKRFVRENLGPGQISGEEIEALAQKMVDAKDPAEAKRLEDEIVRGFYGDVPHA